MIARAAAARDRACAKPSWHCSRSGCRRRSGRIASPVQRPRPRCRPAAVRQPRPTLPYRRRQSRSIMTLRPAFSNPLGGNPAQNHNRFAKPNKTERRRMGDRRDDHTLVNCEARPRKTRLRHLLPGLRVDGIDRMNAKRERRRPRRSRRAKGDETRETEMSARTVTAGLAVLAVLALLPFAPAARAQVSDDVVKIGVLTDMSGPASAATGKGSVTAAQMAVDDFGGKVLGKPISVISGDHQIKPDIGAGIARRWYDTEQVDLIVDVPVSAVGLAVQNIANEKKRLFITHSTGTADFHGKFCSPYAIQWVFDTHALAVGTAQEVTRRGGKTWFFLTADYAFGHALERDATRVIVQNGGKVLGSVSHPFATPDLSSFVLQAQSSKAKIIGLASGPPDNVNAVKLGGEFGVFQGGQQMAGLLVLITDVHALGLKAAQGLFLTTAFYWDMDDQTRAWSKRYFEKLNRMPTMWQAGVYSSVTHYLKAVQATGTDEPLEVAAKMRELPIEDFFARHGKLRPDGLMVHDLVLVEVKKPEESKYPWDYYKILATIPGDTAFPPPDSEA